MILKSPVLIYVTNYICGKTKLLSLRKSVDEINEVIIHDLLPLLSFFFLQFFVQLQINMWWLMLLVQ